MPFRLDLPYPVRFERAFTVHAESPLDELWRVWRRYADYHYLRREYSGATDDHIALVATFVRQAHEFHVASSATSLLTRPLLIYYSLHNLAKAVLLLKAAATPPAYHGLAKAEVGESLLEASAEGRGGLFSALATALGTELPFGKRWTLLELVQNTIELREALARYYDRTTFYLPVIVDARYGGHLELRVAVLPGTEEDFLRQMGEFTALLRDFDAAAENGGIMLVPKEPLPDDPQFEYAAHDLLERHLHFSVFADPDYLIKVAPTPSAVPSAAAYLGYMFILSSIVRYNPRALERFLGAKDSSNEWFIDELCAKAQRAGPNLLLNALHEYPVKIGSQ